MALMSGSDSLLYFMRKSSWYFQNLLVSKIQGVEEGKDIYIGIDIFLKPFLSQLRRNEDWEKIFIISSI